MSLLAQMVYDKRLLIEKYEAGVEHYFATTPHTFDRRQTGKENQRLTEQISELEKKIALHREYKLLPPPPHQNGFSYEQKSTPATLKKMFKEACKAYQKRYGKVGRHLRKPRKK